MNINVKNEPKEGLEHKKMLKPDMMLKPDIQKKPVLLMTYSKNLKPITRSNDDDSLKGRFGWAQIMTNDIPYIFRTDSKYVCYRMLEQKVLSNLFQTFYKELVSCATLRYMQVTLSEAGLLNDINSNHCNFQFGKERFTVEDFLLKLSDAGQLCGFLHSCYMKLENVKDFDISKRCGFIRINKESVVPYSVMNRQKCVPLFYFEGETEDLKQFTWKMENWDLAYLKFCCKIQGIRNDLISGTSSLVVSVNNVKSFFPPNSIFEEHWPARIEPNKELKRTGNTYTLNSIYNMAENAFITKDHNVQQPGASSSSFLQKRPSSPFKKRLTVLQKYINIKNDPTAPNYPSPSIVSVTHEYSSSSYSVYKLQHVLIENKIVVCINMKPNDMNDRWLAVIDLSTDFFFRIPVQICEQVLDVLGIEIYKANTAQMRILRTTGRYNTNEVLSMVQVEKVVQYLPQLSYMMKNIVCKNQNSSAR